MAKAPVNLRFNATNPRAQQVIADQGARLVTRITEDTRKAIIEVIQAGYAKGLGPAQIALDLAGRINSKGKREGGLLGLTAPQAQAAQALKERLLSNVPSEMRKVLNMKLRDGRFDSQITKSIETGVALSEDKVQQMVDRYVSNALRLRGQTIARTETAQAVLSASRESFKQGLEKAGLSDDAVEREWDATGDNKTRDTHEKMDGQVVEGLDEPFVSPSGAELLYPMDTSLGAPPEEVIACRCNCTYRIDYSKGLEDEELDDLIDEDDGGNDPDDLEASGTDGRSLTEIVVDLLKQQGGRTIDEMAQELLKFFPDRDLAKLKASISSLISRPPKSLDIKIIKLGKGRFSGEPIGGGGTVVPPRPPVQPPIVRPPPVVEPPIVRPPPPPTPPLPPVVRPPVPTGSRNLTDTVVNLLTTRGGITVDEIVDVLKVSFPERDASDLRNSVRSLISRLPKQGKLDITKGPGGTYTARIPQGGIATAPKPVEFPTAPKPVELPPRPVANAGDWVPPSDSRTWNTYAEATQGFQENHGFAVRTFIGNNNRDSAGHLPQSVKMIKEIDRALNDLKNRFEVMRQPNTRLTGGLEIKVDKGYLEGKSNGLHYTYQLRMQLAGGELNIKEIPAENFSHRYLVGQHKWTVGGDGSSHALADTFRHEYGHAMERFLLHRTDPFRFSSQEAAEREAVQLGIVRTVATTRRFLDDLVKDPKTVYPSRYGASNGAELWAETFAAYTHPAFVPKSGQIDRRLEDILDSFMKPRANAWMNTNITPASVGYTKK